MLKLTKQPTETYIVGVPFAGKLPIGANVVSGALVAMDPAGVDVTLTVLQSATATIVDNEARFRVKAGAHGVVYRIRLLVTLDSSDVLEEDIEMSVENE